MFNPQLNRLGGLAHFLSTEGLPKRLLEPLLEAAGGPAPLLAGREICLLGPADDGMQWLAEAARRQGAVIRFMPDAPLRPVAGADIHVLRHPASGAAHVLARQAVRVINAGDGWHAQPLVALADLLAIRQAKGGFTELRVAFIGDFLHSGRARSLAHALTTLGAPELRAAGPRPLLPDGLPQLGLSAYDTLEQALEDVDVVLDLGLTPAGLDLLPSAADYARRWTLPPDARVLRAPDPLLFQAAAMAVCGHLLSEAA
ncbi:aspartate carbamoyltransferase [Bordetella avium]|uniref:aspartate carbamoyltransferase n=1 Tax=Bordetella avium TaxID=521 RepID=UPI000E1519BE|nr:aspartate carbamoyltransferase [Bordetella avium]WQE33991.1 aspartate carbamoyltransferase [Bordetella avium]SUV67564.1 aspartate carbamoyltransferase [Bordetella avium]